MTQPSDRARKAAAEYAATHWLWPAPDVSKFTSGALDDYHLTQAFATFERETLDLCWEYNDWVRCGPCALRAHQPQQTKD